MDKNISVGILTYNRPEYFAQVLKNLPFDQFDELVVVNDGLNHYASPSKNEKFTQQSYYVIYGDKQHGIAWAKNQAIKYFIEKKREHVFLIEDDVLIKNPDVFKVYIETANVFGIHHLNFSKIAGNEKTLRYSYKSPSGHSIGFYKNPQGAFSYFNINLIKKLGNFDEIYMNAFEHIDFEYRLVRAKVAPPFWYFPDVLDSDKYLTTIEGSDDNSTITKIGEYQQNYEKSAQHFINKHKKFTSEISDVNKHLLPMFLMNLEKNYSRKKIVNNDKKLSIIIPYRDRETALYELIPKLYEYVRKQITNFDISVIEQDDQKPFNKGLMNNIGFLINKDSDYFCFHDVDLIPIFSDYSYPITPAHLSTHCSQFNYIENPDALMGGVITFNKNDYISVNGYSNSYVGWGREDSDLASRIEKVGLSIYQHPFGRYFSVPHVHRLSNFSEIDLHAKNVNRHEKFLRGEIDQQTDGVNNLDIDEYIVNIDYKEYYKHVKIK